MSQPRFTKGPWTLTHVRGRGVLKEYSIRGMFGDTPNVYPIFSKDGGAIDGGTVYMDAADAHLIAASPELYEALEACLEWIDAVPADTQLPTMPGFDRDWVDEIRAKAKGEQ